MALFVINGIIGAAIILFLSIINVDYYSRGLEFTFWNYYGLVKLSLIIPVIIGIISRLFYIKLAEENDIEVNYIFDVDYIHEEVIVILLLYSGVESMILVGLFYIMVRSIARTFISLKLRENDNN